MSVCVLVVNTFVTIVALTLHKRAHRSKVRFDSECTNTTEPEVPAPRSELLR